MVRGAGLSDDAYLYFEAGSYGRRRCCLRRREADQPHGPEPGLAGWQQELAVNGLALLAGGRDVVMPLSLRVPQAGSFSFEAANLANFGSATVYLRDAQTGTQQLLTAGARYAFTVASATAGPGRFSLVFRPANVTATQSALDASLVSVYPNPTHSKFAVLLPPVAGQKVVQATLLNALGQTVQTRTIALTAAGATSEFNVQGLAAGVYALRLQTGTQLITQRVVVE
jgi:hypothetical protein